MKDYKKLYEEAFERAKDLHDNHPYGEPGNWWTCEQIFPELKESEDEKIRKAIHIYLDWLDGRNKDYQPKGDYTIRDMIAWLVKQSEQKELNLIEILKHYPRETELYSPLYGKLWLAEVDEKNEIITCYKYPLNEGCTRAILEQEDTISFYSNGTTGLPDYTISKDCMLFLYNIEKQGENHIVENNEMVKPADKIEPKFKVGDVVIWDGEEFTIEKVRENTYRISGYDVPIYTQDEFTLKSTTKFNVGDWCIDNVDGTIFQILKVLDNSYRYRTNEGKEYSCSHYSLEIDAKLWTIQDAKDGDVLYCKKRVIDDNEVILIYSGINIRNNVDSYCRYNSKLGFNTYITNVLDAERDFITPATKEQRDFLFQKIKESDLEWDDKKKELKEIE